MLRTELNFSNFSNSSCTLDSVTDLITSNTEFALYDICNNVAELILLFAYTCGYTYFYNCFISYSVFICCYIFCLIVLFAMGLLVYEESIIEILSY